MALRAGAAGPISTESRHDRNREPRMRLFIQMPGRNMHPLLRWLLWAAMIALGALLIVLGAIVLLWLLVAGAALLALRRLQLWWRSRSGGAPASGVQEPLEGEFRVIRPPSDRG